MKYYVNSIEQIIEEEELKEYSKSTQKNDENTALSAYYKKLSDVSADMGEGKKHTYMNIEVKNSVGGVIKTDSIGNYLESLSPQPEPEPEPEPEPDPEPEEA